MTNIIYGIGLGGRPAAGKTTAAMYLAKVTEKTNYPCVVFNTSLYLEGILKLEGIEPTRAAKAERAQLLLADDPEHLNNAVWDQIQRYKHRTPHFRVIPIIDSVRSLEQHQQWVERIPNFKTLYIRSYLDFRFKRYNAREVECERPELSWTKFLKLESSCPAINHKELRESTDPNWIVENDEDIQSFHSRIFRRCNDYTYNLG